MPYLKPTVNKEILHSGWRHFMSFYVPLRFWFLSSKCVQFFWGGYIRRVSLLQPCPVIFYILLPHQPLFNHTLFPPKHKKIVLKKYMSMKLHLKIALNCICFLDSALFHVTSHINHPLQSKRSYLHFFPLHIPHAKSLL